MPEQVKMEADVAEHPNGLPENSLLTMKGKLLFAWTTRDLSQTGVLVDRTVATKEKGDRILDSIADGWVHVIEHIYAFSSRQPGNKSNKTQQSGYLLI
jgi:creatinine amidohydrolase